MMLIKNQLREIRRGGWPVFFRKVRTALNFRSLVFWYLANALWVLPILILIRVLRPLILIRFGNFSYQRIGHFVADVGQRRAESLVDSSRRQVDFWYLPDDHQCSNSYWAQVTRRWFRVHSVVRYLVFWNRIVPFGRSHHINSSGTHHSRDTNGFLEKAKLNLPITLSEESAARKWMAQFGWRDGDPFICLLVRDSVYLSELNPNFDWSYHDFRNSDIQTFRKAIEYLTSQGVFVFRMGKKMSSKVRFEHEKFVDYAFHPGKCDFLDVWLFANCRLCVTTSSGPDMISNVFCRPILVLNFQPLQHLFSWSDTVHHPKTLKWKHSGKTLSMTETLDHSFLKKSDFDLARIEISDLDSDQLYATVKEGWEKVLGRWNQSDQEKKFHRDFHKILQTHRSFENYHGFLHANCRLSFTFVSKIGESFFR